MSTVQNVCLIVVLIFITSVASKLATKQNKLLSQRTKRSDQSLNYRLPNNSLPMSYDLWIMTNIHKSELKFNGRVKIRIKIIEESETITIHSRDIIIDKVDLYDKTGNLSKSSLEFESSKNQDFLIIVLPSLLNVNDEIILDIYYNGNMTNNEMSGLYATSYQNEAKEKIWLASTYFFPISARKAFPCYDEPQIRVPIQLSIQHDKSYHTLSNMQMSKIEALSGTSYVTTTFVETPPIPTHLLSFVVSDLDFISNKNEQFEQNIYGEPFKIRNGTAKFALKTVDEVLNKFIEVLPISLGITKLDHVVIPIFNGVLEHYGLITYEESSLLLDECQFAEEVLEYFKPQIIGTITHCIAHQYFGSIVSNDWWQYLWVNEGITIFFQYHISNLLYPEYDYMGLFQDLIVQPLFGFDIGRTDTINDYVESPTEIQQKLISFIVEKSAVIIRMFYEALSPSTFTKGLTVFLNEMRYKAANSLDLHKALQKAFDDDNPDNNLNISQLMSSWEEQPGYPVISVKKSGNDVILTQKRFPDEKISDFYAIPLTFATKTNSNFSEKTAKVWMTSEVIKINEILTTTDEWIIFNIQLVGYYRVDYSRELWDVIIKGYTTNYEIIHHVNRRALHEELYLGWKVLNTKTASDCLEFMSVLEYETSGIIWMTASYYLQQLHNFLLFSDVYENFQSKMHKILLPHMKVLKASKMLTRNFQLRLESGAL
ncbi:aminopeptidase N-like [Chironomus tepperi]|uniref:aminopeptidase N-like n=1 Tax=Chironomus tepperi TaxID=113505 RepID=UPI00391F7CD1